MRAARFELMANEERAPAKGKASMLKVRDDLQNPDPVTSEEDAPSVSSVPSVGSSPLFARLAVEAGRPFAARAGLQLHAAVVHEVTRLPARSGKRNQTVGRMHTEGLSK